MTPPSIQKFDLEDTGKLVAIIAASEMTREYLTGSAEGLQDWSDHLKRTSI